MPLYRVEFRCDWQPRKLAMGEAMLRKWLAQMGGVGGIDQVRIEAVDKDAEPEKPKMLRFHCKRLISKENRKCDAVWDAPSYTECPVCVHDSSVKNPRANVEKVDPKDYPTQEELAARAAAALDRKNETLKAAGSNAALPMTEATAGGAPADNAPTY